MDEPIIETIETSLPTVPEEPNVTYKSITISGLDKREVAGEPVVPFKTARILIPRGKKVQNIEVVPSEKMYLGKILIEPGQAAVPISCKDNYTSNTSWLGPTLPDERIYTSSEPYPRTTYSTGSIQEKRGYKILYINLYPIMYTPKTKDTYYFGVFDVKVTTAPADVLHEDLFRGTPEDEAVITGMVDNPDAMDTYATYASDLAVMGRSLLLDGQYDYVIVTDQYLKNAPGPYNFQALADWKNSRGVATAIVTTEEIEAAYKYTGPDVPARVRNFIRDAYLNNGVTYVLLGGDGDGAMTGGETKHNIVPARGLWMREEDDWGCCNPPMTIPSDVYYACLSGSFDDNHNEIYGEPIDNPDLLAEVYVGRAPVDSYDELNNFVRKTISYESIDPNDPYLTSAWMVGQYLGLGTVANWGGNYKDEIKDDSSANGYYTVGFPDDRFYESTLYDRDYHGDDCDCNQFDWSKSVIVDIINGNVHIINHIGTTNFCDIVAYVMKMGYNDADALTNDKYFFGYSQAGYAASFDNRNPEGTYLPHDCVLEHFVTASGGAFGFIGNTRDGFGKEGSTDSPSQRYDRMFWDAVFNQSIRNVGRANQISKEANYGLILDEGVDPEKPHYMRYCYYSINLLGDPETPLILPPIRSDWDFGGAEIPVDLEKSDRIGDDAGEPKDADENLEIGDVTESEPEITDDSSVTEEGAESEEPEGYFGDFDIDFGQFDIDDFDIDFGQFDIGDFKIEFGGFNSRTTL